MYIAFSNYRAKGFNLEFVRQQESRFVSMHRSRMLLFSFGKVAYLVACSGELAQFVACLCQVSFPLQAAMENKRIEIDSNTHLL